MFSRHFFRVSATAAICAAGALFTVGANAQSAFSQSLGKGDYEAAGLGKLSDAERAQLDALVGAYASGEHRANATVANETPAIEKAPVPASAKPGKAAPQKKQKVKIDPGTEIEYNTMDSELAGIFSGFEKGTVFTLTNGQRWNVTDGSYVCGPDPRVKKVRVKPGVFGSFFLEFEKVNARPKVQLMK